MKLTVALYLSVVLSVVVADLSGYSYPKPAKTHELQPSPSNVGSREYLPPVSPKETRPVPSRLSTSYLPPGHGEDLRAPPGGASNGPEPFVQAELSPAPGNGHQSLVQPQLRPAPSGVNKEYLPPVTGREVRPAPGRLSAGHQPALQEQLQAPSAHQTQAQPHPAPTNGNNGHHAQVQPHPGPANGNNGHQTLAQLRPAPTNGNNGHQSLAQLRPAPDNGNNGHQTLAQPRPAADNGNNGYQTLAQLRPAPTDGNNGYQIQVQPRPAPSHVSSDYLPPTTNQELRHASSNINSEAEALDAHDRLSEPAHYEFAYEVHDPPSGPEFGHRESRQGDLAKGQYHVVLPDGRMQIVEYEAGSEGYKPVIRYEAAPAHDTSELSAFRSAPEASEAGYRY